MGERYIELVDGGVRLYGRSKRSTEIPKSSKSPETPKAEKRRRPGESLLDRWVWLPGYRRNRWAYGPVHNLRDQLCAAADFAEASEDPLSGTRQVIILNDLAVASKLSSGIDEQLEREINAVADDVRLGKRSFERILGLLVWPRSLWECYDEEVNHARGF